MYVKISKSPTAFEKYFVEERVKDEDIITVFEASPVTPVKSFSYDAYTEAPGDPTSVAEDNAEDDNAGNDDANDTATTTTTTGNDNANANDAANDTNDDAPANDPPANDTPEVPNQPTSAAEDNDVNDEDTAGDDNATDDEDTAGDEGDDAGDDTEDDGNAEDEGGDETADDTTDENNEGGEEGGDNPPDEDAVKKFSYYTSYLRLYNVIDTFVDKLQRVVRSTPISNAVVKVCVDKLTEIQDDLYDFMITKYADVPYYQVRNYFETSILAIQYVFELLRNNKVTM